MKTIVDLKKMKDKSCPPFENAYEFLIRTLENDYISKSNGTERVKQELVNWDKEAREYIVDALIDRIKQSGLMNFNSNDLRQLV